MQCEPKEATGRVRLRVLWLLHGSIVRASADLMGWSEHAAPNTL